MQIIEKRVLSTDKTHELVGKVYIPDGEVKAIFQVVHGMTEYIGRYDAFMQEIAEKGYLVFGYDHLGHGMTAADESELGYFAHENGWMKVVDDVNEFAMSIKNEYGADLPFILMGHSMGSFIVRLAAQKYDFADKLIIMGSGYVDPGKAKAGLSLINVLKAIKGEKAKSPLIDKLLFGSYVSHFADENDIYAWLSKDKSLRERYAADPLCTYKFTLSAYGDLVKMNIECNTDEWFSSVAKKQPILLVAGSDDPVGDYGKGMQTVCDKLTAAGADAKLKLYDNCRHEILNEDCREEVIGEITDFIA